ncbi:MAG TPA: hypothetical protein VJZ06_04915 [Mobilitalea sp.]|nr:hypothetical protein [Mobilitalea sp.]
MTDINKSDNQILLLIPSPEEVRQIFNDTYNIFYKKWKDISTLEQWIDLVQDMSRINQKYNCELCKQILLELVKVIEHGFKQREEYK